jgi:hypothetical protein
MRDIRLGTKTGTFACCIIALSYAAAAETISCGHMGVSVSFQQSEHADLVCEAAEQADALFRQCNVSPALHPVRIDIVDELQSGCVAVYHCGEYSIQIISPPLMQDRRETDGAFIDLGIDEYFKSVVVHELTHAANDDLPCPFEGCVATDEYMAYAMQIMSLDPKDQLRFEERSGIDRRVSSDELSPIMLFMAPDLFAQKAWAHLSQRDNACDYIADLNEGTLRFDLGRF